jgi:hypothetical protein
VLDAHSAGDGTVTLLTGLLPANTAHRGGKARSASAGDGDPGHSAGITVTTHYAEMTRDTRPQ